MTGPAHHHALVALLCAVVGWPLVARADAPEAAAAPVPMRAFRASVPPTIDGALDEPAWQQAEPYRSFVESFPTVGATPSQKTEVRVLYDDRAVYVGVICFDTEPELIERQLGRRDSGPTADLVELAIDSSFDRRSAYLFSVNAAGVLRDGLLYGDVNFADTWDAVWNGQAARRPDGWSVEFEIPLSVLRFPAAVEQRWGIDVRRTIPRTHQVFDATLLPRNANALVSRFGVLEGVRDVKPTRNLEVVPYLAARLNWRPQYSDPATPQPRLLEPSLDLGVDLRATLWSDLTLNATVNPDFGQVEADQLILNLSNSELFFPEKRPFFNQGLDLFQPVGSEYGAPQRLFYSRRIGLDTPIFAAAKVTGTLGRGFQVGVLDAVVMGPADPGKASIAYTDPSEEELVAVESNPDRRVMFHPERPLHVGLNSELPAERPTPKNFLAAVVRKDVTEALSVGASFGASSPLAPRCPGADCLGQGGQVLGLDWNWRSDNRDWVFLGLLDFSRREGGPAEDVQRDGTVIHPSDVGGGGYFKAGKFGGEGFRFDLQGQYSSPRLDLNEVGFLQSQNQSRLGARVRYVRTEGLGPLHGLEVSLSGSTFYTTDGRWTPRGNYLNLDFGLTLPGYQWVGLGADLAVPRYDVREITQSGVPFERRGSLNGYLYAGSDPNRALHAAAAAWLNRSFQAGGPAPVQTGYGVEGAVVWRPQARLETRVDAHFGTDPNGERYVQRLGDEDLAEPTRQHFLFGQQDSQNLSVTLRQTVVFTPRLTLQGYVQFFTAYAHYPAYYSGSVAAGERLDLVALAPTSTTANADFHDAALNLNLVLRWEYRPGSTLFLVYSHSQSELGLSDSQTPTQSLFPARLGPGPATDTVMLKLSYWFSA